MKSESLISDLNDELNLVCRISFRPTAVDGRKTMCYKTMQTRKHNKNTIQFNSVFKLRHKYFPGKLKSFLRITFLYFY